MALHFFRLPRKTTAFLHDVIMAAVSFFVALALRLGDGAWQRLVDELWLPLIIFTAVCALVFWFTASTGESGATPLWTT